MRSAKEADNFPYNTSGGEFSEQILADLIAQGYSGEELLNKFKEMKRKVHPAVEAMFIEAEDIAADKSKYETYADIFGTEEVK